MKKQATRKRQNNLHVMLDDKEMAWLKRWMDENGATSTSDVIRMLVNRLRCRMSKSLPEQKAGMHKISGLK